MNKTFNRTSTDAGALSLNWSDGPLYLTFGLLVLMQVLLISLPVRAADSDHCVSLAWDAVTENEDHTTCDDLAKYRLHMGESSGSYSTSFDAGLNTTYQVCDLLVGHTYYFVVTAVDTSNNESDNSNEVNAFISPSELAQSRPPVLDFDGSGHSNIVTVQNVKVGAQNVLKFKISALDGSSTREELFGVRGDMSALGDYDGDNIADLAVVHRAKSAYKWISKNSSDGQTTTVTFGKAGDRILAGCQFDSHAAFDRAVIKSKNKLIIKKSSDGLLRTVRVKKFPASVKALSCGDLDGNGIDELLVLGRGGPAVKSASYRLSASDRKWSILGFNAISGQQVYARTTASAGRLLAADYDNNSVLDPAYTKQLKNHALRVNFFVGSAQRATALDLEALTGIVEVKLDQSALGNIDGLVYSAKAGSAVKIYNLLSQQIETSALTLGAGERLVGPVSWKH